MKPKRIPNQSLVGQMGINLIERVVTKMGFVWRPTAQHDVGIDGQIEFRNPTTGDMTNLIVAVQSKATEGRLNAETDDSFTYTVDERDLAYWMQGNLPVVLVVSRPATDEGYWVSIKDWYKTRPTTDRRIVFDKRRNRFLAECSHELLALASPSGGVYLGALPKSEVLVPNLLPVDFQVSSFYQAQATVTNPRLLYEALEVKTGEWVLKGGVLYSFRDLREPPLNGFVDTGTVERRSLTEWSQSDDPVLRRYCVELLGGTLTTLLRKRRVRYFHDKRLYFFALPEGQERRSEPNEITQRLRTVVENFRLGDSVYYRHYAAKTKFVRYGEQWYLEVTPTYHYTKDGWNEHPASETFLTGMKRRERHPAVYGLVKFWVDFLTREASFSNPDLEFPFIKLLPPPQLELGVGIRDAAWRKIGEEDLSGIHDATDALREDDVDEGLEPPLEALWN